MNSKTTQRISKLLIKWDNLCIWCIIKRINIKLAFNKWRDMK